MPKIAQINKIKIYINRAEHLPPHFHLIYSGYNVTITINDFKIKGDLPIADLKKIKICYNEIDKKMLLNIFFNFNKHLKK